MSLPINGEIVLLQGLVAPSDADVVVQLLSVDLQPNQEAQLSCRPILQKILADFPQVFIVPSSLPP
jgi:hypothetical protein